MPAAASSREGADRAATTTAKASQNDQLLPLSKRFFMGTSFRVECWPGHMGPVGDLGPHPAAEAEPYHSVGVRRTIPGLDGQEQTLTPFLRPRRVKGHVMPNYHAKRLTSYRA